MAINLHRIIYRLYYIESLNVPVYMFLKKIQLQDSANSTVVGSMHLPACILGLDIRVCMVNLNTLTRHFFTLDIESNIIIMSSISTQVDYEVCHDILVSYLESFDTYANFK